MPRKRAIRALWAGKKNRRAEHPLAGLVKSGVPAGMESAAVDIRVEVIDIFPLCRDQRIHDISD